MMTSTNTASIGLTAHTEAADEAEDEASVHTEETLWKKPAKNRIFGKNQGNR